MILRQENDIKLIRYNNNNTINVIKNSRVNNRKIRILY